jgi:hypothetical protein
MANSLRSSQVAIKKVQKGQAECRGPLGKLEIKGRGQAGGAISWIGPGRMSKFLRLADNDEGIDGRLITLAKNW